VKVCARVGTTTEDSKKIDANVVRQIQREWAVLAIIALPFQALTILAPGATCQAFRRFQRPGRDNCSRQAIALRTQPEAMPTVIEEGFTSGTLEL
jgi:hypothetical protein